MSLSKTNKTLILSLILIFGVISVFINMIPYYSALIIGLIIFSFLKKIISAKFGLICLLISIFSIFYTNYKLPHSDYLYKIAPAQADIRGTIITSPVYDKWKAKFQIETYSIREKNKNWLTKKALSQVSVYSREAPLPKLNLGDKIEINGIINRPFESTNPGQFDYGEYLKTLRIFTVIYTDSKNTRILKHARWDGYNFMLKMNKITDKITSIHGKYFKSPKLEILGGFVFGNYAVPTPG